MASALCPLLVGTNFIVSPTLAFDDVRLEQHELALAVIVEHLDDVLLGGCVPMHPQSSTSPKPRRSARLISIQVPLDIAEPVRAGYIS